MDPRGQDCREVDAPVLPLDEGRRRLSPASRLAYNMADLLRTLAVPDEIERWLLTSLPDKVKIGAKGVAHARHTAFQRAEAAVSRALFRRILEMIDTLRPRQMARR